MQYSILNSLGLPVLVINPTGTIYFASPDAKKLPWLRQNPINKNLWNLLSGDEMMLLHKASITAAKTGNSKHIEFDLQAPHNSYEVKISPHGGKLIMIYSDITKRKILENELGEQKELIEFAQEVGSVGNFVWNIATNKLILSRGLRKLLKKNGKTLTVEDGIKWFEEMVHSGDRAKVRNGMISAVKNLRDLHFECRIMIDKKDYNWVEVRAKYFKNSNDERKMAGVVVDITDRKHTEEYLHFIAKAGEVLSTSLDYKTTLSTIASLAVPTVADWVSIDMITEGGTVEQLAVAHQDKKKVRWARELRERTPVDMSLDTGLPHVLKTGKPLFYPEITDEMLVSNARNKKELELMREIGFSSVIILPLKTPTGVIGAITFVTSDSGRKYTIADYYLAEKLSDRASMAIENSILYKESSAQAERIDTIISNVPGVVWEAYGKPDSKDQRIDYVSDHVEEMLGYSREEWLRSENFWLTIVHPDDKAEAGKHALEHYESGKPGVKRFRWVRKDGTHLWVESHSNVIKDTTGKPIGMRGVTMDITDQIELERRRDDFISMASHELKTPVTSLKVYNQLMRRRLIKDGDRDLTVYSDKMDSQIDRLTKLVRDLLDMSRIQAGKLTLSVNKFDIDDLVHETAEDIDNLVNTHKIRIKGAVGEVRGDKDRISQVMINLLSNAVKYSPSGSEVVVKLKRKNGKIKVCVKDCGIGISKRYQKRIFERFYQVEDNYEKTFPGFGIGLYVSKAIAERHGGNLTVKSAKGKGSTFTLSLPA